MVPESGGCFTNVSRAFPNNLTKIHNTRNHIYGDNFKLKLCTCAQSMACAHVQSFSLTFASQVLFLKYTNSERIFWRARETLVKHPPGYADCPICLNELMPRSQFSCLTIEFGIRYNSMFKKGINQTVCKQLPKSQSKKYKFITGYHNFTRHIIYKNHFAC